MRRNRIGRCKCSGCTSALGWSWCSLSACPSPVAGVKTRVQWIGQGSKQGLGAGDGNDSSCSSRQVERLSGLCSARCHLQELGTRSHGRLARLRECPLLGFPSSIFQFPSFKFQLFPMRQKGLSAGRSLSTAGAEGNKLATADGQTGGLRWDEQRSFPGRKSPKRTVTGQRYFSSSALLVSSR